MKNKKRTYRIADTVITLDWSRSRIPPDLKKNTHTDGFITRARRNPDIYVRVEYGRPPRFKKRGVFKTEKDWRLYEDGRKYVYEVPDSEKRGGVAQVAAIDKNFSRARLFIRRRGMPKNPRRRGRLRPDRWTISDIMLSFMQVLLLNYLAHNKKGVLVHSSALRYAKRTLAFLGRHEAGKSTIARLWKEHSGQADIFNDDRCVIRRKNGRFRVYSTPWPGTFSDYGLGHKGADLDRAYFIYHSKVNEMTRLSPKTAFMKVMQNVFPPFWSGEGMKFVLSFCHGFAKETDCYDLGFINDRNIINFLKKQIKETGHE